MTPRILLLLTVLAAGCHDAPTGFVADNPFEDDETGQLTYNPKNDHTPAFTRSGDSLYYVADSYPSFPETPGVLLAVPRKGGTARVVLEPLQIGVPNQPWLSAPVLSPDGNSIAFFELTDVRNDEFDQVSCPSPPLAGAYDTLGSGSVLQEAVLRVRPINSNSSADAGRITVTFGGRTFNAATDVTTNIAHPFHRLFEGEGVPVFRASWSPDGSRLVFSDGSRLRLWTVGQPTSIVIAGTDDGIMPAWSPDGNWIAFSKPFRGSTQRFACFGLMDNQVLPAGFFDRTVYTPLTREDAQLMIVRPDGTGLRSLGEGDAPAWTPDSRTVIAHRDRNLYSIIIDSGAASIIPNTSDGFEPAVSPDGRSLAFSRRKEIGSGFGEPLSKGNYDIWVVGF